MAKMLMGVFESPAQADMALRELEDKGYAPEEISVISKTNVYEERDKDGKPVAKTAGTGAVTGGAIGGLAGLLAGVGAIPALAGLFLAGPIVGALGLAGVAATTASGAVTGAAAGGLIGALVGLGLPRETAERYEAIVSRGGVVIGLTGRDEMTGQARTVLEKHGAREVQVVEVREQQPAQQQQQQQSSSGGAIHQQPTFGERREPKDET